MKMIFAIVILVAAILGLGFLLFQSSNAPVDETTLPGQAFEIQGQQHIAQGSIEHPPYNSNPPTSGWHWPQPANWGVYDVAPADEQLIHNLEHGGIWISYKPSVDANTITQLKDFARRYRKVVVAPREANDANVALAAWGRLQKMENYSETDVIRFIEAFYDQGPEKVD